MKWLSLLTLLIASVCSAQGVSVAFPGPGISYAAGTTTVQCGYTTTGGSNDSGNANFTFFTPCVVPAGTSAVIQSCSIAVGSPDSTKSWGCAVYNNNSGAAGSLNCSSVTASAPSSGVNTLSLLGAGCSNPANGSTIYAGQITGSNTQQQKEDTTSCPSGGNTTFTGTPHASTAFPSPATQDGSLATATGKCYTAYITLAITGSGGGTITPDSSGACNAVVAATSISCSYTVGTSAHPVLVAQLSATGGGSITSPACTYNSVSMTSIGQKGDGANGNAQAVFILTGMASGAQTIACTWTGNKDAKLVFSSYFGVNQATPNRTAFLVNDGGSKSTPSTVTVSNAVSGDYVVDGMTIFASSGTTIGAGQSAVAASPYQNIDGDFGFTAGSSFEAATGSTTMTWSNITTVFWSEIAFALIPG